jgi:hypothetical protein
MLCLCSLQADFKGLPVVTLALQLLLAVPAYMLVPATAAAGELTVDRKRLIDVPDELVAVLQQLVQDPDVSDSMQCTVVSNTSFSRCYTTWHQSLSAVRLHVHTLSGAHAESCSQC